VAEQKTPGDDANAGPPPPPIAWGQDPSRTPLPPWAARPPYVTPEPATPTEDTGTARPVAHPTPNPVGPLNRIPTTPHGPSPQPRAPVTDDRALPYGPGAARMSDLLAVGVTADHRGEEPTLWRRPLP
jgi:hypothetical protein